MRLFVAVTPLPAVVEHLTAALEPLRAASPPSLRWQPSERWHVTLVFLGEVDESRVARLHAGLAAALVGCRAPELSLAGSGAFGRSVLWVGVVGDLPALARVAGAAATAARAARVPVERRPFRAHLTVARVRGDADLGPHRAGLRGYAGPPWTASEVVLYRSHLGPDPRHEVLGRFPLAVGATAGP